MLIEASAVEATAIDRRGKVPGGRSGDDVAAPSDRGVNACDGPSANPSTAASRKLRGHDV